eukprot:9492863-Pyramimonas_sp.AAC.1
MQDRSDARSAGITLLHFTGPPLPITARMHLTPQRPLQEAQVYSHDGPTWGVECILAVIGTGGPIK